MNQQTAQQRNQWLLLIAVMLCGCSGSREGASGDKPTDAPLDLPAAAIIERGANGSGIKLLSAPDLAERLEAGSTYRQALGVKNYGEAAVAFVASYAGLFAVNSRSQAFQVRSVEPDPSGTTVVRLDQLHNGLPVFGGELLMHYSGDSLSRVVGDYAADLPSELAAVTASDDQARKAVSAQLDGLADCAACVTQLGIFVPFRTDLHGSALAPRLAWQVDASTSPLNAWRYLIDAQTLAILDKQPRSFSRLR